MHATRFYKDLEESDMNKVGYLMHCLGSCNTPCSTAAALDTVSSPFCCASLVQLTKAHVLVVSIKSCTSHK